MAWSEFSAPGYSDVAAVAGKQEGTIPEALGDEAMRDGDLVLDHRASTESPTRAYQPRIQLVPDASVGRAGNGVFWGDVQVSPGDGERAMQSSR